MPGCYAVIGGYNYEGEDFDSLGLFDCRSAAVAYSKFLEEDGYDYVLIQERLIDTKSALCAA